MKTRNGIGIFDSGLGGLTVMKQIRARCPHESIVYFGDTARLPYGGKSPEAIVKFTIENAIFLMEQNVKVIVVACNTASSYSIERLRGIFNVPIVEVIGPGAEKAASVTKTGRIGILGTKATITSGSYQRAIEKRVPNAEIFPYACPLFVPLVEERFLYHPATRLIVKEYLEPVKRANVDTLLLGCTHYPVLAPLIQEELGYNVHLVDSASTCADHLEKLLELQNLKEENRDSPAECRFYVSDDPDKFKLLGQQFLGEKIGSCELFRHELQSV